MIYIDSSNNKFFQRFARYIQYELLLDGKNGEFEITNDYSKRGTWLLHYASFVNRVHDIIVPNGCEYIAIQTEPQEKYRKTGYKEFLDGAQKVYYYHDNFQIGYSDFWRLEMEEAKDIDVLFVGAINDLRQDILTQIPNATIKSDLYGDELLRTVMRSKINLSIRYYPNNNTDWERIPQLVCNKNFVIGEEYQDNTLNNICFEAGIVLGKREDIPKLCKYYLDNPLLRLKSSDKAFEWMKKNYLTVFR